VFSSDLLKNKNILYLPAINYSQLLQLEYYDKEKFGFDILNWTDFDFYEKIPKFLDEETGVNMVVSNIKKYLEKDYSLLVNSKLEKFFNTNQNPYFEKRREYINKFKGNVGKEIARIIIEDNQGGGENGNTK